LADIFCTNYSKISIEYIFEESKNSPFSKSFDINLIDENKHQTCFSCENHLTENFHKTQCSHLNLIENFVIKTNIDTLEELDKKIGKLLWDLSEENDFKIIRFKGIIKIKENNDVIKFMSLQGLYDLYEFNEIVIKEKNNLFKEFQKGSFYSKILFIGKNIKPNIKIFQNCLNK